MNPKLSYLLLLVFILASCQREQDWGGAPDIKAKVESEQKTRTSISVDETGAGTIYWNPADKIDVFFGTSKATYTSQNSSDAMTAVFKTTDSVSGSDVSSTNIWGLYPSNSSSTCNGSSVTTTLPSTQYGVPNTFDDDLFLAVAHSSTTDLQFFNVCGGIKFNLAYDDIKKISFCGNYKEPLAGRVSISFENGVPKATVISGVSEITLLPKSGSTFEQGVDYYIALLPCSLFDGFSMTFTKTDGTVGTFIYTDKTVSLKRSVFSTKSQIDTFASFGPVQPNNVIYYTTHSETVVTPYVDSGFGATIVSNDYIDGRGILTFSGEVTSVGPHAFVLCDLTSIQLPNTVNTIGEYAFADCYDLNSIEIPNSVTSIGYGAFDSCTSLSFIEIPKSVTSIEGYGNPFADCASLSSIIVEEGNPVFDSRNGCNAIIRSSNNELISGCMNTVIPTTVTSIGVRAFRGCSSMTTIEIPNSVTHIMNYAFDFCSSLASIDIPNSVSFIGEGAFWGCRALTVIQIPCSVTSIGKGAFGNCNQLETIVVESGNPIYDSRNNCNAIIETDTNVLRVGCKGSFIPDSVTCIGDEAFFWCTSLISIDIPRSVTRIGTNAFSSCQGLSHIAVNAINPPIIGAYTFLDTNNCPIYVPAESVDAYKSAWSEYADRIQAMHEYVDLGLSVKWATCNIGASSPEEYGDYFAWGETEPKNGSSHWSNYTWCNGSSSSFTKYNIHSDLGTVDHKIGLDLEDDAAHVNWGGYWRMPTMAELEELHYQCTWTWTTQGGKNGYRVTGPNGNSIFLPASGYWAGDARSGVGSVGVFWSSTLWPDQSTNASLLRYDSGVIAENGFGRDYAMPIRPVCAEYVSVEGVSLNKSSLTLMEGESEFLDETISPSNATEKSVSWSSDNPSVATASYWYGVTAVSPGTATITAWSADGRKTATCTVTVIAGTHEAVDLGLSVKWATCNLGATEPEGYGDYYAWGETEPYYSTQDPLTWKEGKTGYNWASYQWCNGSSNTLTRYCPSDKTSYWGGSGSPDGETEFKDYNYVDDASRQKLGGKWRTPTDAEWTELRSNCIWTWTAQNGVEGYTVTSRKTGYKDKSIFLPAAGGRDDAGLNEVGTYGSYWSSSLYITYPYGAWFMFFCEGDVYNNPGHRCLGFSVRPVSE